MNGDSTTVDAGCWLADLSEHERGGEDMKIELRKVEQTRATLCIWDTCDS